MPLTKRQHIESLGQSVLTNLLDLKRTAICPSCGQQNLGILFQNKSLTVVCETPNGFDLETNLQTCCPFNLTINPTDLECPPFNFKFATEKPVRAPVRQKRVKASRKTALKRRVPPGSEYLGSPRVT